jgi:hypothetical protein
MTSKPILFTITCCPPQKLHDLCQQVASGNTICLSFHLEIQQTRSILKDLIYNVVSFDPNERRLCFTRGFYQGQLALFAASIFNVSVATEIELEQLVFQKSTMGTTGRRNFMGSALWCNSSSHVLS